MKINLTMDPNVLDHQLCVLPKQDVLSHLDKISQMAFDVSSNLVTFLCKRCLAENTDCQKESGACGHCMAASFLNNFLHKCSFVTGKSF